jgi:hypothetical protein
MTGAVTLLKEAPVISLARDALLKNPTSLFAANQVMPFSHQRFGFHLPRKSLHYNASVLNNPKGAGFVRAMQRTAWGWLIRP